MEFSDKRHNRMEHIGGLLGAVTNMIYTPEMLECDYLEKGLIYCGKCHTPKEKLQEFDFGDGEITVLKVPITCKCQEAELKAQEEADKARKAAERIERWRKNGLVMPIWQEASFEKDDRRDAEASKLCRTYADKFDEMQEKSQSILLLGNVGCGKTYLAACIADKVLNSGKPVLMNNFANLISQMQADYGAEREAILDRISSVPLLIIDDLGVERDSEYVLETAYTIINTRYISNKPLIVTTNKSLAELSEEQNLSKRRIYDRVIEMCTPILVKGGSRRMDIAIKKSAKLKEMLLKGSEENTISGKEKL